MATMQEKEDRRPQRIGIIGGGISGIACSWGLRAHDCDVDIYEADVRLGGHANSVLFHGPDFTVSVDTGFVVLDEKRYPLFTSFLREVNVKTIPTDMSFGVSVDNGMFEWGSHSIRSFCHSFGLLFTLWFWRILFDIVRFSLFAEEILSIDQSTSVSPKWTAQLSRNPPGRSQDESHLGSIGTYMKKQRYSRQFIKYVLIPMVAAPWYIDPDEFAHTFPAHTLVKFMFSHGILDTVTSSLRYRSLREGSKTYVDEFQKQLPTRHRVYLNTKIQSVIEWDDRASIQLHDGSYKQYDHVVLAVHANQALGLLGERATYAQLRILGSFKTSHNVCYLHSDTSFLPKRPSACVAWNCRLDHQPVEDQVRKLGAPNNGNIAKQASSNISITFDMNKLQNIPLPGQPGSPGRVLVTMNPTHVPRKSQSSHVYCHPLISSDSVRMADRLDEINGIGSISFAGSWMGFGFHEDGFMAGSHVAKVLINGRENTNGMNLMARLDDNTLRNRGLGLFIVKLVVALVQRLIVFT